MTDPRTDLADAVSALVDPIRHAETYELRAPYPGGGPKQEIRVWRTTHPSLLDQLAQAAQPSTSQAEAGGNRIPESRPPAALDPIHVLTVIERETAEWMHYLDIANRGDTAANLRALVGGMDTPQDLANAARSWVSQARIATGWDKPAYQPPAPCPVASCGARHGLRVNLEAKTARCVECKTVWKDTDGTLQILAEHVRWYTETEKAKTPA